jgi:hypothetical protein
MSEEDRRKSQRFAVTVPVRITLGAESFAGVLHDLCRDAALIESQRECPVGSDLRLALALPGTGGPLQVAGRVIRLAPDEGEGHVFAILFTDVTPAVETRIDFFIALQGG